LIAGPTALATPVGAHRVDVLSAQNMFDAVKREAANAEIFISVAAVADYHVVDSKEHKIKRSAANMTIELAPNPDILAHVAGMKNGPFCVGFAAESEKLHEHATAKRARKGVPLLVGNLAQTALGAEDNEITLFDDAGAHTLPRAPKSVLARQLIEHIAKLYTAQRR
jgi:phosphopantothenoylcysteine decarboxylase / phosphopantothenate---cysteine ligase